MELGCREETLVFWADPLRWSSSKGGRCSPQMQMEIRDAAAKLRPGRAETALVRVRPLMLLGGGARSVEGARLRPYQCARGRLHSTWHLIYARILPCALVSIFHSSFIGSNTAQLIDRGLFRNTPGVCGRPSGRPQPQRTSLEGGFMDV